MSQKWILQDISLHGFLEVLRSYAFFFFFFLMRHVGWFAKTEKHQITQKTSPNKNQVYKSFKFGHLPKASKRGKKQQTTTKKTEKKQEKTKKQEKKNKNQPRPFRFGLLERPKKSTSPKLGQAIEAKEDVKIQAESVTLASWGNQAEKLSESGCMFFFFG